VESPLQKQSLSSRLTQALAAPIAVLSLGALSAPAEIFLISPPECEKVAKVDPIVGYGMLTSQLVDRSDRDLYELTLTRVKGMAEDAMSQHLCELAVPLSLGRAPRTGPNPRSRRRALADERARSVP
jgi:hypothetical protein